jgi:hypothetical protein
VPVTNAPRAYTHQIHIQQTYNLPLTLAQHASSLPPALRPRAYIRLTFPFYEMKSSSTGYTETFVSEDKKKKGFFGGNETEGGMRPDGVRGRWWHEAVRAVGAEENLNLAVIRVGEIYGAGYCDQSQVLGRLVVGHIYQYR